MKTYLQRLLLGLLIASVAEGAVVLKQDGSRVDVAIDGKPFTSFFFGADAPKPYLHPLRSASGKIVTRRFPMEDVASDGTTDKHHRGVWAGYGQINGFNFWETEFSYNNPKAGKVVTRSVEVKQDAAQIAGKFAWLSPSGETLFDESRTMTFVEGDPAVRVIDFELVLKAVLKVEFGDSKDGFFAVRVAEGLNEKHSGELVNAEGGRKMAGTWGKTSAWVDYSGVLEGERLGVTLFAHPSNFHNPPRWHVRDYGLLASNPFGSSAFDKTVAATNAVLVPGETVKLRYRVVIHGPMAMAAMSAMFGQYAFAPGLRIEPVDAGSLLFVKNNSTKPMIALLIELVDYPGSNFALLHDETSMTPIAPGAEWRVHTTNMTVGAAPSYVKLQAAVYADGSASGAPEKVKQLVEFRRAKLAAVREIVQRMERLKAGAATDLKAWRESLPEPSKLSRYEAAGLQRSMLRSLIAEAVSDLGTHAPDAVLGRFRGMLETLAAVK